MMIASVAALWVLVLFLAVATLLIYKQVGELVMQASPNRDPNDQGPELGEPVPSIKAFDLSTSAPVDYTPRQELLLFAMPGCPGCEQIASTLPGIAEAHPDIPVTFLTVFAERDLQGVDNEVTRVGELVLPETMQSPEGRHGIRVLAAASSSEEGPHRTYGITGTPFALLIDEESRVKAKAALRAMDHLERILTPA